MNKSSVDLTLDNIEAVLDKRVRPALALHGGNIMISTFEDTALYVQLTGQCSGCASADLTIENLVETELKAAFPSLTEIKLVTGVSNRLLAEAQKLLNRRHA